MAKLTMRVIDEYERLVMEKFRLELKRCDLIEQSVLTPEGHETDRDMRQLVRAETEVYIELMPLLRQRVRNARLRSEAKKRAEAALDREFEELAAKWQPRVDALCAIRRTRKSRSTCSAR